MILVGPIEQEHHKISGKGHQMCVCVCVCGCSLGVVL